MGIPVVTREYTTGSCRNSRKHMRLHPRHEMRPDSPTLHAEQLCFPNQTHKEPRFAWLNSRESPTRLSQDKKNTDVTSGMQNWLVYPKSTQDEAHFPFIESIAVSHSTSYTTSVLTSLWLFVKIDRNSNITVPNNKGRLATRLTFSSVRTVLPSLV